MIILISMTVVLYSIVSIVGTPVSPPGPDTYVQTTPCAAAFCGGDSICVAVPQDPTCSRGPCRLIANCIPRPTFEQRPGTRPVYERGQCSRMNCPRGTSCVEVSDPYCFRYPCQEIARCVPNNNNNNNNNRPGYNNNNNNNNRPGYNNNNNNNNRPGYNNNNNNNNRPGYGR